MIFSPSILLKVFGEMEWLGNHQWNCVAVRLPVVPMTGTNGRERFGATQLASGLEKAHLAWCIWMFLVSPYLHIEVIINASLAGCSNDYGSGTWFSVWFVCFFFRCSIFSRPQLEPLNWGDHPRQHRQLSSLHLGQVSQPTTKNWPLKRPSNSSLSQGCVVYWGQKLEYHWTCETGWGLCFFERNLFFQFFSWMSYSVFYSNPDTQCMLYLPYIYHKKLTIHVGKIYHTLSVWVQVMFVSSRIWLGLKKIDPPGLMLLCLHGIRFSTLDLALDRGRIPANQGL